MSLNKLLLKYANALDKTMNSIYKFNRFEQEEYINSFPEPKDDIQRSYYQYKCQMKLINPLIFIIINIISLPLSIFYLIKYRDVHDTQREVDAVFAHSTLPIKGLPDDIINTYDRIERVKEHRIRIDKNDRSFLKSIFIEYPFSWHFWLKIIIKTGYYSYIIDTYHPRAVISCSEYSFTSSAMTMFCNINNVKHLNVMHGEKLFFMRDSFFRFDKCYIWDEYYSGIFKSLRTEKKQFVAYNSNNNVFKGNYNIKYDYKYYLQDESHEVLIEINNRLKQLELKGFNIAVRPHPAYSDMHEIKDIFNDIEIENYKEVNIAESVLECKNVISLCSTVLYQAYCSKVSVVIDDCTRRDDFLKLREYGYIMLSKEHKLLSEIL